MSYNAAFMQRALAENFVHCVEQYLEEHPEGVKEYDLLDHLTARGFFQESRIGASPSLILFQKHFLLFHVLYNLNENMIRQQNGSLYISPLLIQKRSFAEASKEIGTYDPLREYYLDLSQLEQATEENVNALLQSFWEMYLRNDQRQEALTVLGLQDPVNDSEITASYRRLARIHHPDKGGKKEKIQEINHAYNKLKKS